MLINSKCLNTGDNLWMLIPTLIVVSIFFSAMLEEFYKGIMVLGPGNGVSDGSIVVIVWYIVIGIYGNQWMSTTLTEVHGFELNFTRIFCIITFVSQIICII